MPGDGEFLVRRVRGFSDSSIQHGTVWSEVNTDAKSINSPGGPGV